MKAASIVKTLVSGLFHFTAIVILFLAFRPIAQWYLEHRPILGVDFFNTATHVRMLLGDFALPPWGVKYFWFGGYPIFLDLAIFWFYPISLVARFIPFISAVKVAVLAGFFLLTVFVYLAAFRLSRHHLFSAVLAVLVVYSANMYGSLTWGGSLPYFANQLFFPAILWLIASYLDTGDRRWYWTAVLAMGLAFLGHALNAGTFALAGAVILLVFGQRNAVTTLRRRAGEVLVFFVGGIAVSYRVGQTIILGLVDSLLAGRILIPFGVERGTPVRFGEGITKAALEDPQAAYERSRFEVLFTDTNQWLYLLFGLALAFFLVALIADKKKRQVLGILPWGILAGYSVLHVFANSYGLKFLPQAWYRAFWHFPVTLALLTAAIVGYSLGAFSRLATTLGRILAIALVVFSVAAFGVVYNSNELGKMLEIVDRKSSPSSAYPEAINLVRSEEELMELKEQLVPEWLDPTDRNWRIYESDAQVNVWWNALFDMPMARGYIDPPQPTNRMGHIFLTDQAIGADGLVENFDYPVEVARNMALYYLDWNAIRYFEGGHVSISDNKTPSSYLADVIAERAQTKTVGLYRLYETPSGKPEIMDIPQYLEYYRFSDAVVSPILSISKAPAILCFCDWGAYESLTKVLSMNNLNSRILVSAFTQESIDSFSQEDLSTFDLLVLANYRYHNQERAFSLLRDYTSAGGKVFIDTGSEVRESEALTLPSFFPFSETVREGLGTTWDLTPTDEPVFQKINLETFSEPVYNGSPWKFSHPRGDIESASEVLLRQRGEPVLVRWSIGEGIVLWSGMNLAYHVHANTNMEESRFVVNLLSSLVPLEEHDYLEGKPEFVSAREVRINSPEAGRGVLFKEQYYPGWKASVGGKRTKVFAAGPAFPGYMYVPLPTRGPIEARFTHVGQPAWYLRETFSLFLALVLLDLFMMDGRIVGKRLARAGEALRKHIGRWWEREEE